MRGFPQLCKDFGQIGRNKDHTVCQVQKQSKSLPRQNHDHLEISKLSGATICTRRGIASARESDRRSGQAGRLRIVANSEPVTALQ